ncbi:ditrans,polycis-undecaprenyl-diphosphate synthase [Salvia divinorum]|uniref:Ditrans,polycis-undecaprenyl-diphosphate synthase n=1 Tax=Salvia divinorum TaxID=28513 RepID=A0ABD1G6Z9_SALDI
MIGNKSRLPVSLQTSISWAEETSKGNKGQNLVMAANYSGRDDVVQATKDLQQSGTWDSTSRRHRRDHLAYTEFYFVDKLFPDFGEDDLRQALASYGCRQRRYGLRKN